MLVNIYHTDHPSNTMDIVDSILRDVAHVNF